MRSRIPAALFVAAAVPSTTVAFKRGASSAAVQGKLQGPDADARDYVVRAGAGQSKSAAHTLKIAVVI